MLGKILSYLWDNINTIVFISELYEKLYCIKWNTKTGTFIYQNLDSNREPDNKKQDDEQNRITWDSR